MKLKYIIGAAILFGITGCTHDEISESAVPVLFDIAVHQKGQWSISPADHHVDRILVLPFRKIDENAADDDANFEPYFAAAKQLDVDVFPALAVMLDLPSASSYQVIITGCNRNDYDLYDPLKAGTRFAFTPSANQTLDNLCLQPASPTEVPEFFTGRCTAYVDGTPAGTVFVPRKGLRLTGNMERLASGLLLEVSDIPDFVDSVALVADGLVKSSRVSDGVPVLRQISGDAEARQLGKLKPTDGKTEFAVYLLPTGDMYKTKLYLDILYAGNKERYEVKVADVPDISSGNEIIFKPNRLVSIKGDYAAINIGFTINHQINLEDDAWDGL